MKKQRPLEKISTKNLTISYSHTTVAFEMKVKNLFIVLLVAIALILSGPLYLQAFDTFEHRYIGDRALQALPLDEEDQTSQDWIKVFEDLGLHNNKSSEESEGNSNELLQNEYLFYASRIPLTFGDLPALAGDHVGSVEQLKIVLDLLQRAKDPKERNTFQDRLAPLFKPFKITYTIESEMIRFSALRRQWENMCRWLSGTISDPSAHFSFSQQTACPQKALDIQDHPLNNARSSPPGSTGYLPSRSEDAEFEQLSGYIALVSKNKTHFPRYAWKVYLDHHQKAIGNAHDYAKAKADGRLPDAQAALEQAILNEGFAQHFLQDSFSSGHIGTRYDGAQKDLLQHTHDTLNYIGTKCDGAQKDLLQHIHDTLGHIDIRCDGAQKDLLQHTHDTLNHIGKSVRIPSPPEFLWLMNPAFAITNARQKTQNRWTAFGDRHLFILDAAFHRFVVVHVASRSLQDVWDASKNADSTCQMCTNQIFPIPDQFFPRPDFLPSLIDLDDKDKNEKSLIPREIEKDIRVPPLYSEGWKLLAGFGTFRGEKGSVPPPAAHEIPREGGTSIELGYIRGTGPGVPNYFGVGFNSLPNVSTSIYPLSLGYRWPQEITAETVGLYGGIRLNVGYRKVEADSFLDPRTGRLSGIESTAVIDGGYQLRSPLSLFMRIDLLTINVRKGGASDDIDITVDSPLSDGVGGFFGGIQYDLTGVLK